MQEVDLSKIMMRCFHSVFILLTLLIQVFQLLGATYTEAVKFPEEVSECGNITLVNGTVKDGLVKPRNGSMIVSVRLECIFRRIIDGDPKF